jgi:polysaccharide export outer membrane protein
MSRFSAVARLFTAAFAVFLSGQVYSQSADAPAGYLLGHGDRISIQVFDEPDLTMEARIGSSGVINYSYLGDVRVKDKTPQELEQHITKLLSDGYLVNPSVNITIVEYRPFFINGEVRNPGSYPYQPGLTLGKAVALAGGLTDRASKRKMYILKAQSEGQSQSRAKMSSRIQPGDIVTIKEGFF